MKRIVLLVLVLLLVLSGCASQNKSAIYESAVSTSYESSSNSLDAILGSSGEYYSDNEFDYVEEETVEQKKIKRGNISIEVEDISKSYEEIKSLVVSNEGYIHSMVEYSTSRDSSISMVVKVKAANFEVLYDKVKEVGKVKEANMSSEDVTREYIDTKARIETLKVQEESLLNILSKADKVEDLLMVETELQRVREKIESSQGNLNYLENSINYSDLSISISMSKIPEKISEDMSIIEEIVFHIKDGLGYWGNVLLNIIYITLWNLPLILVIVVVFIVLKKNKSKIKGIFRIRKDIPDSNKD